MCICLLCVPRLCRHLYPGIRSDNGDKQTVPSPIDSDPVSAKCLKANGRGPQPAPPTKPQKITIHSNMSPESPVLLWPITRYSLAPSYTIQFRMFMVVPENDCVSQNDGTVGACALVRGIAVSLPSFCESADLDVVHLRCKKILCPTPTSLVGNEHFLFGSQNDRRNHIGVIARVTRSKRIPDRQRTMGVLPRTHWSPSQHP